MVDTKADQVTPNLMQIIRETEEALIEVVRQPKDWATFNSTGGRHTRERFSDAVIRLNAQYHNLARLYKIAYNKGYVDRLPNPCECMYWDFNPI